MRGHIYSKTIKNTAAKLRAEGKTYREIKQKLGIPKSTLSEWLSEKFQGIFDKEAQLIHLTKIRPLAAEAKRKERERQKSILQTKVRKEIMAYPLGHIGLWKSIIAVLYWAEGAKHNKVTGLKFVNTDPMLALFYIDLLRKCYNLDEQKFRIRLHLHYYHRVKAAKKFWSKLLKISLDKFGKTYIKKRSKTKRFRRNFMGICFINYLDSDIRKEVLEIGHQLQKFLEYRS